MWLTWTHAIFFWGDHENTMMMLREIYVFSWKDKRVIMRAIPPTSKSIEEEMSKLISICNQCKFFVESKKIK